MRIPFLLCLFVVSFAPSYAQNNALLPVRIQFKNAFIDTSGQVKIQTRYDHLGDINLPWYGQEQSWSGYFLAEVNGMVGLVDSTLKEVVAPAWQEVHPVNDDVFLVSPRTNFYTAIDRSGKDLLGAPYHQIEFPQQGKTPYFIVRKDGKCGVQHKNGRVIIPFNYSHIDFLETGKGLFKANKSYVGDSLWLVLTPDNKQIFEKPKVNIQSAGKYYFAARDMNIFGGLWIVYEPTGKEKARLPFYGINSFVGLNRHMLGFRGSDSPKTYLYLFATQKIEISEIDSLWMLEENLVVARVGNKINIVDSLGNRIELDSGLVDLRPGSGKLLRARCKNGKWGLFSLADKKTPVCEFDHIGTYDGRFAVCNRDGRSGAIDRSGREVVPTQYDWIKIEGHIVEAYVDNQIYQYEFNEKGQHSLYGPFNYQEYRVAWSGAYYEMEDLLEEPDEEDSDSVAVMPRRRVVPAPAPEPLKITVKELNDQGTGRIEAGNNMFWILTGEGYVLSRPVSPDGKRTKPVREDAFKKLFGLQELNWTLAVHRFSPVKNALSRTLGFSNGTNRIEIFDNSTGQFIPDLAILGIRPADFRDSVLHAAFIDLDGRMGLISRSGKQALDPNGQPLRYDYIGRLHEEKIRVCTRGALRATGDRENNTPMITSVYDLMGNFMLQKVAGKEDKDLINSELRIVRKNKSAPLPLWGYLDRGGKILIEPSFEYAADFIDSSAVNLKNKKWGVIGHSGQVVIPFKYDLIRPDSNYWRTYSLNADKIYFGVDGRVFPDSAGAQMLHNPEGLFVCRDTNGLFGYADALMHMRIPGRFRQARYFSEGLAAVRDENNRWGFIDTTGNIVFRPEMPENRPVIDVGDFHEGLCWVKEGAKKKCGYVDRSGQLAIELKFEKTFDFKGGVAIVGVGVRENHQRGLIDNQGGYLVRPGTYSLIFPFTLSGYTRVCEPSVRVAKGSEGQDTLVNTVLCGLVNALGELVLPVRFERIVATAEGFSVQDSTSGRKWSFYDLNGQPFGEWSYTGASEISHGMSIVSGSGNMQNYIDVKTGNTIFSVFRGSPFYEGYAAFKMQDPDKFGSNNAIMDLKGTITNIPYGIQFYREGKVGAFFSEKKDGARKLLFLTPEGKPLYYRSFTYIQPFSDGLAAVAPKNSMGILNARGMMVVPPKYASIGREKMRGTNKIALWVKPKYKRGLYTREGRLIVEPGYDRLAVLPNGLLRVEWGDQIGYLRLRDGAWVWPMQR